MIDEDRLYELAGPASFERGVEYLQDGRVALSCRNDDGVEAQAEGTATYRLWLRDDPAGLLWHCECPMAAQGNFCKHLVAAGLAWLDDADIGTPEPPDKGLLAALKREPAERLAEWLHTAALNDPTLANRLRLQLSGEPGQIKKALGSMLNTRGFLDYRESLEYGAQLDTPLALLRDMLAYDPAQCYALTDYALTRLLRIYERSDDSAGGIGDAIHEFADLHSRTAPTADISGDKLATALYKLKRKDDWGFFPLARYWDALGDQGRATYARRVCKEYDALPAEGARADKDISRWTAESPIVDRREELARAEGDLDALIAVLSRSLSSGYTYEKIVAACRDCGQDALALEWVERGLNAYPDWPGIRIQAAELYRNAGRHEEALEQLYTDLISRPGRESWKRLRKAAGEGWPALREKALAELAKREPRPRGGGRDASTRIDLLRLEGDFDSARELARTHAVTPLLLKDLAEDVAEQHPIDAAAFLRRATAVELGRAKAQDYARIVPWIRRAMDLDAGAGAERWLADIRNRYKARRKLMRLMDEAALR